MIEIRRASSPDDVAVAIDVLDRIIGAQEGWRAVRDRTVDVYATDPALLAMALDDGRVVGAVGSDGTQGIDVIGVDPAYRRRGIGRRLLDEAEDTLRQRGARRVGLGSVDDAVAFYLGCGYVPQLLVQFGSEAGSPRAVVEDLFGGLLRDHEVFQADFHGSPQLWVQVGAVDFAFKAQIEAVAPGTVAQYIMSKEL